MEAPQEYSTLNPYNYYAVLTLIHENRITQSIKVDIPILKKRLVDNNIYINNIKTPLVGVWWDQTESLPNDAKTLQSILDRGFNSILLTQTQSPEFYQLCDKLGIWVVDIANIELTTTQLINNRDVELAQEPDAIEQISQRILRQYSLTRNNPSIVASIGSISSHNGYPLQEAYVSLKSVDKDIVFAATANDYQWNNDFRVWTEWDQKINNNFTNFVIFSDMNFSQLVQQINDKSLAGAFTSLQSAINSNTIQSVSLSLSQNNYRVEIQNPIIPSELISVWVELRSDDNQLLESFQQASTNSLRVISGEINFDEIEQFILNSGTKQRRFKVRVVAQSGATKLSSEEFEYRTTKK